MSSKPELSTTKNVMENLHSINNILSQNSDKKPSIVQVQSNNKLKDIQEETQSASSTVKSLQINQIDKKQLSTKNNPVITSSKEVGTLSVKKTGSGKLQTDKLIKHIKNNSNTITPTPTAVVQAPPIQSNASTNINNQLKSDLFMKNKLSNFSKVEKRSVK